MHPDRRSGFVLPTTLLVMTLLTVMLTAAFTLVSAEYRTTDNSAAITRAQALAEAGLQSYLSMNRQLTGTYDSVRVTMSGGYADVIARRLRDSTIVNPKRRAIWLLRSSGYAADAILIGQLQAQRTVAQVAEYDPARFPAEAAMFAPNGVYLAGNGSGTNPISGIDAGSCSPLRNRPGLLTSSYVEENSGTDPTPTPGQGLMVMSAADVIDSTHIDWPALMSGDFTPDYTVPPGPPSWATEAVYLVTGDHILQSTADPGKGILVVTGNLTFPPTAHWHGLIIVGGYLRATSLSNVRIHGMIMTGLNVALSQFVPPDTIERAGLDIYWRSCDFDDGVATLASMSPRRGTWVNTWSSY